MNLNEFKNVLFDKANKMGFVDYEIFVQTGNSFSVKINKGEIEQYSNSYASGVGFRGIYNGRMGYSFSEKIDVSVCDFLLTNAKDNCELLETTEIEEIFEGSKKYEIANTYNEKLNNTTVEEKIEFAKQLEKFVMEEDERVKLITHCVLSSGESEISIYNSKGLELSEKSNYALAYVYLAVEENGLTKIAGDYWVGQDFSEFNPKKIATSAVNRAVNLLGATSLKSGEYNIILENETAVDFLGVYTSVFFAYDVQKGFSKLKGKLNQKIGSDKLTLIDIGIYEGSISNSSFDSEGVATSETVLIEKGILKNYLYNLKSAKVDGVKSTGNGFKSSFRDTVNTSITNFYIKNGEISFENLVSKMNTGIIVTDIEGLHSGASAVSGDFSFIASGFYVENGKVVKPVEQFTVAGNFFDVLENVVEIADDFKFGMPSIGNIGSPSLFVGKLMVGSE